VLRALASLLAVTAALGLAACGGSDDESEPETTATATTANGAEVEFPEAQAIIDCLVDAGFPEPTIGTPPPDNPDAPDVEFAFDGGNNQPVFVAYYESADLAAEMEENLAKAARSLNGEYVLEGSVGLTFIDTPAGAREEIEACAWG
jgi:hypothetical protein